MEAPGLSRIGLSGLDIVGQNLALNIADKGFSVSVYHHLHSKVEETIARAAFEGGLQVSGHRSFSSFISSIQTPRCIIIRPPNHGAMLAFSQLIEPGDTIVEAGNSLYQTAEHHIGEANARGILYLGMRISGGEYGARHGPSLMARGSFEGYENVEDVLSKIAAHTIDGPCLAFVGEGCAGNFGEMINSAIECGEIQMILDAYEILKKIGGFSNKECGEIFADWNCGELNSLLLEIISDFGNDEVECLRTFLTDKILDKTFMPGTAHNIFLAAADHHFFIPTLATSIQAFYIREDKEIDIVKNVHPNRYINKKRLVEDTRDALYVTKICCYAQGLGLLYAKSHREGWNIDIAKVITAWRVAAY